MQVRDDAVLGDNKELWLSEATAWVGRVGDYPRSLRTALSRDSSLREDQLQLVVYTPSGDLLRRNVAADVEAEARAFAIHLNAASADGRRSWDGPADIEPITPDCRVLLEDEDPRTMSFAGIQVRDDTVVGDGKVLDLFYSMALVGRVGEFSGFLRRALRRDGCPRDDDRPQLIV